MTALPPDHDAIGFDLDADVLRFEPDCVSALDRRIGYDAPGLVTTRRPTVASDLLATVLRNVRQRSLREHEGIIDKLHSRQFLCVHHHLERFNALHY